MPKERRLTKSFTASRLKEVSVIPLAWHVKRVLDHTYCELDLRVAELNNFKKQCGYLFDVSHSRNITQDTSKEELVKPNTSTNEETTEQWFKNSSSVLKIDLSLNNLVLLEISDLELFTELRSLDVSLNKITHFGGVMACSQLTSLCLAYNDISDLPVSALEQCKYLYSMDLRSNQISDLSKLPNMPSLEILNISHNALKTLDGLQVLRSIRKLFAQDNKLEGIVEVGACSSLQIVDLSRNQIPTLHSLVEVMKHLQQMQQLNVDENPFVESEPASIVHEEIFEKTTVILLNGTNIRSFQKQFSGLPLSKPPPANESIRLSLKQAVRDVMWQNLKTMEKRHESYLQYLHKKLLNMIVDMEEFTEQTELDTEAWCTLQKLPGAKLEKKSWDPRFRHNLCLTSYIDTLSPEEVKGLSVSKIRALALTGPDGSTMALDDKIMRRKPPHHKK